MQAYYTYLVTHFRAMSYDTPEGLTAFLMEQLRQQRSLYNVENALRAVYSSRRVPLVLTALETLAGDNQSSSIRSCWWTDCVLEVALCMEGTPQRRSEEVGFLPNRSDHADKHIEAQKNCSAA